MKKNKKWVSVSQRQSVTTNDEIWIKEDSDEEEVSEEDDEEEFSEEMYIIQLLKKYKRLKIERK